MGKMIVDKTKNLLYILVMLALFGCQDNSTSPEQLSSKRVDPKIWILAEDVLTLDRGSRDTLQVKFTDSTGILVPHPPEAYSWVSSNPEAVSVAVGGILNTGPGLGGTWVVVQAPTGERDSVLVWVQAPKGEPSSFRITFIYAEDVAQKWRDTFESAADRWEEVIRGELPEVQLNTAGGDCPTPPGEPEIPPLTGVERGVRIYVGMSGGFRPGTYITATGGPCLQRALPYPTTILGVITLNRDHPVNTIPYRELRYVAVHEVGHALGLVGIVQGVFPPEWIDDEAELYKGILALEGYRREFGSQPDHLMLKSFHWTFERDVMSADVIRRDRITHVSVGALMDFGYPAAWYGAGRY